jgi:Cu-Zn family superoxide dismutase
MGDMGNITADAQGNASIDYVDETIHINMILGRGVIVHNGEDDLSSQPSGAAGPRVACGVIGIAFDSE